MPPKDHPTRYRDVSQDDIEAPKPYKALDNIPIRNSFTLGRHTAGPSTRPAPLSPRRPLELPQRSSYQTMPTKSYIDQKSNGKQKPSPRPLVSQPRQLADSVTASASWDLDAAEYTALSQPEPSYPDGDESDGDDLCSPTASDIEALEESFYEFEIQSSQAEAEAVQNSSRALDVPSKVATSVYRGQAFLERLTKCILPRKETPDQI